MEIINCFGPLIIENHTLLRPIRFLAWFDSMTFMGVAKAVATGRLGTSAGNSVAAEGSGLESGPALCRQGRRGITFCDCWRIGGPGRNRSFHDFQ